MDVSCALLRGRDREVEEPLFFESSSQGLPGIEKGALIEIVKGVFGLPDSPRGWWKELRDTVQETHGNLSNWTLPSSACVTVLDISSE